MKRWVVLTVLLYFTALLLLTVPVFLVAFGNPTKLPDSGERLQEAIALFREWGYWLWLAVLVAGQVLLLLLPVNIAARKLTPRRPLKATVFTTSFFLANLCFAALLALLCAAFKEKGFNFFDWVSPFTGSQTDTAQGGQSSSDNDISGWGFLFGAIATVAIFWCIWAVLFFRFARSSDPESLSKRATRWLLRGSVLELLVAVPSHIIVRQRNDCCAPMGTFWGITMGISVMLLCFGPGVFFLFVERFGRLRPKTPVN